MNSSISWASLGSSSLPDPTFFLFVCRFFWLLVCQSYLSIHLFIHPIWLRWRAKRELIRTFRFCRQIALPHCSIMCHRHVQAAHEDVEVEILVFFTRCGQCSGQQIFYVPVGKASFSSMPLLNDVPVIFQKFHQKKHRLSQSLLFGQSWL